MQKTRSDSQPLSAVSRELNGSTHRYPAASGRVYTCGGAGVGAESVSVSVSFRTTDDNKEVSGAFSVCSVSCVRLAPRRRATRA